MPICHDGYMGTAPDLSGSISKNRFRNELFGVSIVCSHVWIPELIHLLLSLTIVAI